jgi:adenylosuccinate synthase
MVKGKETQELPFELNDDIQCNYTAFKGWKTALDSKEYGNLPNPLQDYVSYLENYLKVPVSMISTGPEREKLIIKQDVLV